MSARPIPACGTVQAYWRHQRLCQPVDQPCRDAWNAWRREPPPRREPAPCGTERAYWRHVKRHELADPACLAAHAAAGRERDRAARIEREIERILPHIHLEEPQEDAA